MRDSHTRAQQTMGLPTVDAIEVRGLDLTSQLIGQIGFVDLIWLEILGRVPTDREARVLDAVLVSLAEHGLTPTAIVARMTDFGAPGTIQAAVAAGLLGAGDRFLGAIEGSARILQEWPDDVRTAQHADAVVAAARRERKRMPGLGHPTHVNGDPRTQALFAVGRDAHLPPEPFERMDALRDAVQRATGRVLPINVDGAAAVLLTGAGVPWNVTRGMALIARCAGLVGHIADEARSPTGPAIWDATERAVQYVNPTDTASR